VRKPIGKKVSGDTATLQFDGPTRIEVVWQPVEGTLTFTPINVPAGVKSLRADMLIDFSYVNGGSWQIGQGKEMPFPAQQPAKLHLFQGNADTLKLRNFEGATLTVRVPPSSFQQLTDNRAASREESSSSRWFQTSPQGLRGLPASLHAVRVDAHQSRCAAASSPSQPAAHRAAGHSVACT
jgi:hypothetical protein